jgi:uncharacterized protein (TIGR00725 family)
MNKTLQISVIGSAGAEEYPQNQGTKLENLILAEEVGKLLAKNGCTVINGGKGGIMEAASRGAKEAGGRTVGIISGTKRLQSNNFTDIEVLTGSNAAGLDEFLLVLMSDALIVIGGGAGTLEEITIAYRNKKPIIAINNTNGWADSLAGKFLDERKTIKIEEAENAKNAVAKAIRIAKNNLHTHPL